MGLGGPLGLPQLKKGGVCLSWWGRDKQKIWQLKTDHDDHWYYSPSIAPCGHMIDSHAPFLGREKLCPHDQCPHDSHQTCIVGAKGRESGMQGRGLRSSLRRWLKTRPQWGTRVSWADSCLPCQGPEHRKRECQRHSWEAGTMLWYRFSRMGQGSRPLTSLVARF